MRNKRLKKASTFLHWAEALYSETRISRPMAPKMKREMGVKTTIPNLTNDVWCLSNRAQKIFATCVIMLFNSVVSPAYSKVSKLSSDKEPQTLCGSPMSSGERSLSKKEMMQISSLLAKVEALESKEFYKEATSHYHKVKNIIMNAEGSCSINGARTRIIYGTKLFRAFRLEEAEMEIKKGLEILQLHDMTSKEICDEAIGGISFLSMIYTKKSDNKSLSETFFKGWPYLKKCLKSQGEVTKPRLFDVFIRLSLDFFAGYHQDPTETKRKERAELAFDALKKAYNVVDGKPTQEQMAEILLKEGYFKYLMSSTRKDRERDDLLLRSKEATIQALRIITELNKPEHAASAVKQLAYILESLGDYTQADSLYRGLILRALSKPLKVKDLNEDRSLLSGYVAFNRDWNEGAGFGAALLKLRQWEYVALKTLLPSITPKERLEYLSLFALSEDLASIGFLKKVINAEEYLDSFLQLRYSLIEAELIALKMLRQGISVPRQGEFTQKSDIMARASLGFTNQIRETLKDNELFLQFVEGSDFGQKYPAISSAEIESNTQAFIVRNKKDHRSITAYSVCKKELCDGLMTHALSSSSEGLEDASQRWHLLMDNLFTPSIIEEIRGVDLIYVGLDGFLQKVPIGIIRTYLKSKGLESIRVISIQSLANIGNHERKLLDGISTVFYAPEFGDKPKCKSSISCQKQWVNLAYSSKEGEAISELTSAHKLFGKYASKSSFLAIKNPRILHVSSHAGFAEELESGGLGSSSAKGVQRALDGLYNLYIVTSGANLHSAKDTIITYKDLAGLDLSGTSLVVISACQTGLGRSTRGYGLFGLHRILSSVGADTTLLSMWKVDDEATSILMSMFYENLKEGYTVDQSLARAQDRMIEDPKLISRGWAHPYYWAGWQVAGKMDPVFGK